MNGSTSRGWSRRRSSFSQQIWVDQSASIEPTTTAAAQSVALFVRLVFRLLANSLTLQALSQTLERLAGQIPSADGHTCSPIPNLASGVLDSRTGLGNPRVELRLAQLRELVELPQQTPDALPSLSRRGQEREGVDESRKGRAQSQHDGLRPSPR